ncbi:MAG: hypothetical protein KJ600_01695 [Nanoarchaeota archaeon]|nr:hypothetical protein [Nanoarchaeota archaeon]MBU1103252.1 hypothetical protein [Nanoarchaeota archaeon]
MVEKKNNSMDEAIDEINSSLEDSRGLEIHKIRLGSVLSAGVVSLIENYLKKLDVFKSGGKIDHRWLKKKKENAKSLIGNQITCPVENVERLDVFLDKAYKIESERNKIVYGSNVSEDNLKKLIDLFLELKKEVGK